MKFYYYQIEFADQNSVVIGTNKERMKEIRQADIDEYPESEVTELYESDADAMITSSMMHQEIDRMG